MFYSPLPEMERRKGIVQGEKRRKSRIPLKKTQRKPTCDYPSYMKRRFIICGIYGFNLFPTCCLYYNQNIVMFF